MELAEARGAAQAELDRMSSPTAPLRLVDDADVADVGWGWVYAWNTARWFATRDPADGRRPARARWSWSRTPARRSTSAPAPSFDVQLADYAREHGLAEPAPLGW